MSGIKQTLKNFLRPRRPFAAILMYHRIGDVKPDPWETSVSAAHFEEQMKIIHQRFDVCSFSDILDSGIEKEDGRRKIIITFDDGYLDNYDMAVPVLQSYGFPATFFIPSQILKKKQYFWWEMLDALFWDSAIRPEALTSAFKSDCFPEGLITKMTSRRSVIEDIWSANTTAPPTARCDLYLKLSIFIKGKKVEEQRRITDYLRTVYEDLTSGEADYSKMNGNQLISLVGEGFELGGHTVHHPALGFQDEAIQRKEIMEGKLQLEELSGKPLISFAYPHGHRNEQTPPLIKDAGFKFACTTEKGIICRDSDRMLLPRFWVKDWDAVTFERNLNHCLK